MHALRMWIDKPQNHWFRKLLFQVHLWIGIGVGLYVILIGVTGAALVFRDEMEHGVSTKLQSTAPAPASDLLALADSVRAKYPDRILTSIRNPTAEEPSVRAYLRKKEDYLALDIDPVSGAVLEVKVRRLPF